MSNISSIINMRSLFACEDRFGDLGLSLRCLFPLIGSNEGVNSVNVANKM
jgi:hypothetical protein